MMRENYSKDFDYHSQRNNAVVPFSSCNTTSMVMALKQARWPVPDRGAQPEDELSRFLRTPEALEKQKELAPWSVDAYPPQQVHTCLEWGTNEWVGGDADRFRMNVAPLDLITALETGGGVVLSGRFPMPGGIELGHIVSLAGYVRTKGEITHWIIDDPYGDWYSEYKHHRGNDIEFSLENFNKIFMRDDGYWAHIISRYHW